jgi:hypothetical protein
MSTIDSVRLQHYDERYAPPEQSVLDLSLVGDCLHLTVSEYDETFDTTETKVLSQVGVDVNSFFEAIVLLVNDQELQAIKRDIPFQERLPVYVG